MKDIKLTRVSKHTDHFKLGISIYMSLSNFEKVQVVAIGNDAAGIMTRGIIAADMLANQNGVKLSYKPAYLNTVDNDGNERVALSWLVERAC